MLGADPFYFSIIKKMTAVFGTLFNELVIPRYDANGAITELLHVPISYAPKEKVEAREIDDPNIMKQSAVSPLPRLSFELSGGPHYDSSRQLNPSQTSAIMKDAVTKDYKHQYMPVPYNFPFTLWVYAKNVEDGNKIVEQIFPFFRPEFPVKVELIPELNYTANIPIVLNSSNMTDTYDGEFKERRAIIWTLDFTMKGFMFGPITEDKIIKFANVNFYAPTVVNLVDAVGKTNAIDRVTSQPGLTANGQPTSNIALTIPYIQIGADDPYGYIDIVYGDLSTGEGTGGNQANNLPWQG